MSAPQIHHIEAQLILAMQPADVADSRRFLDALQATALAPTHWGRTSGERAPWDRVAIEQYVASQTPHTLVLHLRRTQPPRMRAKIYGGDHGLSSAVFELQPVQDADDAATLFDAITQLGDALPLELGTVDVRFVDQDPATFCYEGGSLHHLRSFADEGPHVLMPRTMFGPRLVALMGGTAALEQCGGEVTMRSTGTVVLDLVPQPWAADPKAVKRAQAQIDRKLRLTGILARNAGPIDTLPGPRWRPLHASPDPSAKP